jgi:hypothetical protein
MYSFVQKSGYKAHHGMETLYFLAGKMALRRKSVLVFFFASREVCSVDWLKSCARFDLMQVFPVK